MSDWVRITYDERFTEEESPVCDVCGTSESLGVAASAIGPISFAYCENCLSLHAEPYWMLVSTLAAIGAVESSEGLAPWMESIIKGTLQVANKTMQELIEDVRKAEQEYDDYIRGAEPHDESKDFSFDTFPAALPSE